MGEGVGKGLDALIGSKVEGDQTGKTSDRTAVIRKLNDELLDLNIKVSSQKKDVEDLRRDLTVELMLRGKVDNRPLMEAEDLLRALLKERDRIQREIDILVMSGQGQRQTPEPSPDRSTNGSKPQSTDIDMRMIRELLPKKDPQSPIGAFDGAPNSMEYEEGLREELSPRRMAYALRREAGKQKGPNEWEEPSTLQRSKVGPTIPDDSPSRVRETVKESPPESVDTAPPTFKETMPQETLTDEREDEGPKERSTSSLSKDKRMYVVMDKAVRTMEEGDPERAKSILLKALRVYPMDDELLYHLGNAYFMLGDLDNAEIRFRKSAERNPASYRALNNLGVVLRKKGNRERAIHALNRSIEANARYERAWFNLGTIFMEIDPPLLKEAHIFLRRALECDPSYQKAKEKLAECERLLKGTS